MFKNVAIFETAQRKELVQVKIAANETQSEPLKSILFFGTWLIGQQPQCSEP